MSYSAAGDLVDIRDPNLRLEIAGMLNKSANTPITRIEMETLTRPLRASNKSIMDLTGLEFAVNLKTLFLSGNNISDISPLENLTNLKALVLSENPISDISPLENLTNLKTLVLSENQITDIAPLRNLKRLETLRLIDDTGGFENLRGQKLAMWLEQGTSTVHDGDLVDIRDPNLRREIAKKLNKSVDGLLTQEDMKKLTGAFRAANKSITNLTGLEFAVNLKTLFLSGNNISDISPLENLTNLKVLVLSENPISDISPLENLTNLKTLVLSENQITDIAPLRNLKRLETLRLIDDTGGFENLRGQKLAMWLEQGTSTVYDDEFLSSVGMWCSTPHHIKIENDWIPTVPALFAHGGDLLLGVYLSGSKRILYTRKPLLTMVLF